MLHDCEAFCGQAQHLFCLWTLFDPEARNSWPCIESLDAWELLGAIHCGSLLHNTGIFSSASPKK